LADSDAIYLEDFDVVFGYCTSLDIKYNPISNWKNHYKG